MKALAVVLGLIACLVGGCGGGGGGGGEGDPEYAFGAANLQYRVFENPSSNRYQAFLPMTKDGKAIQEADIDDIRIYDSANNVLVAITDGFSAETYMRLDCLNGPCSQSGPIKENGFWGTFASLLADTYSVEVDAADGQALSLDEPFPGQLVLPYVSSSTMQSAWVGSDLVLSWTNPTAAANWAEVDELRIRLFDGTGAAVLYVKLNPATNTVTINNGLYIQAAGLGNGSLVSWEVQTRAYDNNNMNFARAYSNKGVLETRPCLGEVIDPIGLTLGKTLNETIEPLGTKFYVFEIADLEQGFYAISLYNMATDNDWVLYEYISNCEDDYPADPPVIAESSNLGTVPDYMVVPLEPKKYLLVVNEWDGQPSSYALDVTKYIFPDDIPGLPGPGWF